MNTGSYRCVTYILAILSLYAVYLEKMIDKRKFAWCFYVLCWPHGYQISPRPRHTDVNYAGDAQHQDEGRHEDQSVREHGPLDSNARGVSSSDEILLLQRQMDIRRDNW